MRLTNFDGNNHNYCIPRKDFVLNININDNCCGNVVDKLGQYEDIDESPEHLAKVKKALEIIKTKKVDIVGIEKLSLEDYNKGVELGDEYKPEEMEEYPYKKLTEEEYDLLREVLL